MRTIEKNISDHKEALTLEKDEWETSELKEMTQQIRQEFREINDLLPLFFDETGSSIIFDPRT